MNPILLVSDGPCVLAMTEVQHGLKFYYTTFTSIDSGRTWDVRGWNTQYKTPTPRLFHGNNLFSARTTDDRRGTRPTCVIQCGDIFTTFNIGLNWDYADFPYRGVPFMLRMFDPRHGLTTSFVWSKDSTLVTGMTVTDTGHVGKTHFTLTFPGQASSADGITIGLDTILMSFRIKDSMLLTRTIDGGKNWRWMQFSRGQGLLHPLVEGYSSERIYAIRRNATNDLLSSTTGGAVWDTVGANTGRANNLYEPGPERLWMMVARDTMTPVPNPWYTKNSILCDTFYFSSDEGRSWTVDETFAGDTVCMMSWSTRDLGYVLSKRNGKTYVSRFTPYETSSVEPAKADQTSIVASPNPFADRITLQSSGPLNVTIRLLDALGHTLVNTHSIINGELLLDLPSDLAPGVYVLQLIDERGVVSSVKLVRK